MYLTVSGESICYIMQIVSVAVRLFGANIVSYMYIKQAFLASPWRAPYKSQLWLALLDKCEGLVRSWTALSQYNCFMDVAAVVVQEFGLLEAVLNPTAFSGVAYWSMRTCLKAPWSKYVPAMPEVLANGCGVNAFWQSCTGDEQSDACVRGGAHHVEAGSAWDAFWQHVESQKIAQAVTEYVGEKPKRRRESQKVSVPKLDALPWPEMLVDEVFLSCPSITALSQVQ